MQTQFKFNLQDQSLMQDSDEALTPYLIRQMESHNFYKAHEAKEHWDSLAFSYDDVYLRAGYPDPEMVAEAAFGLTKNSVHSPEESLVLDFGCGTGLVGEALKKKGFKKIHGIDISSNMLAEAKKKEVYARLDEVTLCQTDFYDSFPTHLRGKYDFVTAAGLINNNHMDYKLFEQMMMACKKSGYIIFAARFSYLGLFWYQEALEQLEKDGRLKLIKSKEFFKYTKLKESIGKFSKTPVRVYVYRKMEPSAGEAIRQGKLQKQLTRSSTKSLDQDWGL